MDITKFIVARRQDGLLAGDYDAYRRQLSRRVLAVRRKLGRTTPKGRKYAAKSAITAADVSSNSEYAHLMLLTAERAWAQAMYMRNSNVSDTSAAVTSRATKVHITSRLKKAERQAYDLVGIVRSLHSGEGSELLEAQAYAIMLTATRQFEREKWEDCTKSYSASYLIYSTLGKDSRVNEACQELLNTVMEPSIRYAAYQLKVPRTMATRSIAIKYKPDEPEISEALLKLDPTVFSTETAGEAISTVGEAQDIPTTVTWRTRTVTLEDARIAQALGSANAAQEKLTSTLESAATTSTAEKASAYDDVLNYSQVAVDATKEAIEELTASGATQSDSRIQNLQITRTALNYALVGWRVGRNRILCGADDGAHLERESKKRPSEKHQTSVETRGRKIMRLRERVVLYDTNLQSIDSIKEFPGVAGDQKLLEELASKRSYFAALRCLSIARSHALNSRPRDALALFARALHHSSLITHTTPAPSSPTALTLDITTPQANRVKTLLQSLTLRQRALVEAQGLYAAAEKTAAQKAHGATPLVERLDEFPLNGVDLANLVTYPARLRPVPAKPIFLDVAWNYIRYPGEGGGVAGADAEAMDVDGKDRADDDGKKNDASLSEKKEQQQQQKKSGWFGFGR